MLYLLFVDTVKSPLQVPTPKQMLNQKHRRNKCNARSKFKPSLWQGKHHLLIKQWYRYRRLRRRNLKEFDVREVEEFVQRIRWVWMSRAVTEQISMPRIGCPARTTEWWWTRKTIKAVMWEARLRCGNRRDNLPTLTDSLLCHPGRGHRLRVIRRTRHV